METTAAQWDAVEDTRCSVPDACADAEKLAGCMLKRSAASCSASDELSRCCPVTSRTSKHADNSEAPPSDAVSLRRSSDRAGQKNEGGLKPLLVKTEGG